MAGIGSKLGINRSRGFTLIEVLVALVVVAVGLAALLQLQSSFIKGATDSEKRAVGMALAEKKLEEFRNYQDIASFDAIGSAALPTSEVEAVSVGKSSIDYTLSWAGINTVSSAVNASEYKEVTVTVSWDGGASSLGLSTIVARIDPNVSPLLGHTGVGGGFPGVSHAAGDVPDVIPIDIGDGKTKETSKPLPDVDQSNESTEVRFETVTYDTTTTKLVQEEFVTVNCFCQLQTNTTASLETPYHYKYENGAIVVEKGVSYTAGGGSNDTKGTVYGSGSFTQSQYCTRCCAGHHDASDASIYSTNEVPGFKSATPASPHPHYEVDTSTGVLTGDVAGNGDVYAEACRFRRVDGIFELFPDWKLIDLNVMPYAYLASSASSALSDYQAYVIDRIQDQVFGTTSSAMPGGRDFTANNGEIKQLMSRGIYYDDMSFDSGWNSYIASFVADGAVASQAWLSEVPFFEINTTLLSEWEPIETDPVASAAYVTSEIIDTIEDDIANYYGVYSRGAVVMATSGTGSQAITAISKVDNTGLLGNTYANPSSFKGKDNEIVPNTDQLSDTVIATLGECSSNCSVIVSGFILKNNGKDLAQVSIYANGTLCSLAPIESAGGGKLPFTCELPTGTNSVTLAPVTTEAGATFDSTSMVVDTSGGNVTGISINLIKS
ncbi:MAG: prepilin-type N-terminal cleavage/methylation domain-containing protein [Oceanospirillales bacterium]|nr:prepilin-type N-terminal cleavage/methylation domain-containing protein [Oceanospirillales bacterium]